MPIAPPKSCSRCGAVVPAGQRCGRCVQARAKQVDSRRGSFRERGYTGAWDKLRAKYIKAFPICERCEREGRLRLADMVHHRKPVGDGGEVLDWENLESLCNPCHKRTHDELGSKGR